MAVKGKMVTRSNTAGKTKLRTAADVISRLKWTNQTDENNDHGQQEFFWQSSTILVGYHDRIIGPMEKNLLDFVSVTNGGDIPEHRILYFRQQNRNDGDEDDDSLVLRPEDILWDRAGRVDRIFHSGNGANAPIATETMDAVNQARINMIRIEEEKAIRREKKAKDKARRQTAFKKKRFSKQLDSKIGTTVGNGRFHWYCVPWYFYSIEKHEWSVGIHDQNPEEHLPAPREKVASEHVELTVATWNVLFDLYDEGIEKESTTGYKEANGSLSQNRWNLLCSILEEANADLISLQEVTPSFVRVLCECDWVRQNYATSSCPSSLESVSPSGVMILWRRWTMTTFSSDRTLFQCSDFGRNRSLIASLFDSNNDNTILFAAAHLPADNVIENVSRQLARRRELCAIVGQVEQISKSLAERTITPIIAGDFNSEDELMDGAFASLDESNRTIFLFRDAWLQSRTTVRSFTFDPETNQRANRSSSLTGGNGLPKRIDRIFIGPSYDSGFHASLRNLTAIQASLLGTTNDDELPASDHFGVVAVLQTQDISAPQEPCTQQYSSPWAAISPPNPHYILAVILDNPKLEKLKRTFNSQSTLPLLHISLLHGFSEVDCFHGCLDLAKSEVHASMLAASSSDVPSLLNFREQDALNVLDHNSSCSIVALPDRDDRGFHWLVDLYSELRNRFKLCSVQESHNGQTWTPHVTLGVLGSTLTARETMKSWILNGCWDADGETISIRSVDILKRAESGKFFTISSFPVHSRPAIPCTVKYLLSDDGERLSRRAQELASVVKFRVERACRQVTSDTPIQCTVHFIGSAQLLASLPDVSDVDAIVLIKPECGDDSTSSEWLRRFSCNNCFLESIYGAMSEEVSGVKAWFRPADGSYIMTIRMPGLPPVDLALCSCNYDDSLFRESFCRPLESLKDGQEILNSIELAGGPPLVKSFQGALRIIKVWAMRRDISGASCGFLGGGGWALWLARCTLDYYDAGAGKEVSSQQLVYVFFNTAAEVASSGLVMLHSDDEIRAQDMQVRRSAPLYILAPVSKGNLARTTTKSTIQTIFSEIKSAAHLELMSLLQQTSQFPSLATMSSVICFEIYKKCTETDSPHEDEKSRLRAIKSGGDICFLNMLVKLETEIGNPEKFRPKSTPFRIPHRYVLEEHDCHAFGFCWTVGILESDEMFLAAVQKFASRNILSLLEESDTDWKSHTRFLRRNDFCKHFHNS